MDTITQKSEISCLLLGFLWENAKVEAFSKALMNSQYSTDLHDFHESPLLIITKLPFNMYLIFSNMMTISNQSKWQWQQKRKKTGDWKQFHTTRHSRETKSILVNSRHLLERTVRACLQPPTEHSCYDSVTFLWTWWAVATPAQQSRLSLTLLSPIPTVTQAAPKHHPHTKTWVKVYIFYILWGNDWDP